MKHFGLQNTRSSTGTVLAVVLVATSLGVPGAPAQVGEVSFAYLQWLHSLERTVAVREAADGQEQTLLYPFDTPAWNEGAGGPAYRHLAISRAVGELEEIWSDREQGRGPSALVALANARNYVNLSEYDSALVWYEIAAMGDTAGRFADDIGREVLAAATVSRDSLATLRHLTNTLGESDLRDRDGEVVVAYRWLLITRNARLVDHLIEKVARDDARLTGRVRYWHAYALAWRGRYQESLGQLRALIAGGPLSHGLSEGQRAWVLQAIPDLQYLGDEPDLARLNYQALAGSALPQLSLWGTYQIAGLDLQSARYEQARAGFEAVCQGRRLGPWQDNACALVDVAAELSRIQSEGEAYGTAAHFRP